MTVRAAKAFPEKDPRGFFSICPHCRGTGLLAPKLDTVTLVAAIADMVGDRVFSVNELMRHADVVGGPLRKAICGKNSKQIGKALRKAKGIIRLGRDKSGAIWVVRDS